MVAIKNKLNNIIKKEKKTMKIKVKVIRPLGDTTAEDNGAWWL